MSDTYTFDSDEQAEWSTIILGRYDDAPEDSIYPVIDAVRTTQLAVFERKVILGDSSKDSDDFISSYIQGDWSGGGQVFEINEGSDLNRFWWSTAETRYPNQISLPPYTLKTRPDGLEGSPRCVVIGDVTNAAGADPTLYAAFGNALYGWNEGSATWYASTRTLAGSPVGKAVRFKGTNANVRTFLPLGDNGWAALHESSKGSLASLATGSEKFLAFAVLDTAIYAIASNGKLYISTDGTTWTSGSAPFSPKRDEQGNDVVFDMSRQPRSLEVFFYENSPHLHLISDRDVWLWDESQADWQLTNVQYPPHPDFGYATAVWRPGEDLWIGAGMDVVKYTPANVIVPLAGPSRDDGVPSNYWGKIVALAPEPSCLYAVLAGVDTPVSDTFIEDAGDMVGDDAASFSNVVSNPSVLAWNGYGWHCVWENPDEPADPTSAVVSNAAAYRLWWGMDDGWCYTQKLRRTFHNPKQGLQAGVDEFTQSAYVETGRFDAAMRGFDKLASHVIVFMDSASDTEYAEVLYETDISPNNWITLPRTDGGGTRANKPGRNSFVFNPNGDGDNEGQYFNWIRFRIKLVRAAGDANRKKSPVMDSLVFHYTKIPQNTSTFVFTIPLPKVQWGGRTGKEMSDRLHDLTVEREYLKFVHQGREYRVRVSQVTGADATGRDYSGQRTVSLIALHPVY